MSSPNALPLVLKTALTVIVLSALWRLPGCSESGAEPPKLGSPSSREPEIREGDVIYAVAAADDRFLAIDPKTASVRTVGELGMKIGGMEDLALASDGRSAIAAYWEGYPALLSINLKTGRATPGPRIKGGSLTDKSVVESLAMIDGELYGASSNAKSYCDDCASLLVRIDPKTGRATEVGPFGPQFLNMEAMAYSPEYGLIGADIGTLTPPDFRTINTQPALARIDPKTGRATRIGNLPPSKIKLVKSGPYRSPEGPYVCGLCFGPDGTLYGSTFPTHFGGLSQLIAIDPADASIRDPRFMNALNIDGLVYVRPSASPLKSRGTSKVSGPAR